MRDMLGLCVFQRTRRAPHPDLPPSPPHRLSVLALLRGSPGGGGGGGGVRGGGRGGGGVGGGGGGRRPEVQGHLSKGLETHTSIQLTQRNTGTRNRAHRHFSLS